MRLIPKNRLPVLVLMLMSSILLCGCVSLDMHIQVFADGTAQSEVKFLVKPAFGELARDTSWVDTMRANAEKSGFTTRTLKEGNLVGFGAVSKRLPLDQLPTLQQGSIGKMQGLNVRKSFFTTKYTLNTVMDLTSATGTSSPSVPGSTITAAFLSQVDMKFRLTLPITVTTSNASSVSSDGKALTWNLLIGKSNPIKAEATAPNIMNIALVACLGLAAVILAIFATRNRNVSPDDANG